MAVPLPEKQYLKTSEVATAFGVDQSTVFLWVKKGKLQPVRTPGGVFRFRRDAVARLLDSQQPDLTERRRAPRFVAGWPVVLAVRGLSLPAEITDISNTGMGLVVRDPESSTGLVDSVNGDRVTILNASVVFLKSSIPAEVKFCRRLNKTDMAIGVSLA